MHSLYSEAVQLERTIREIKSSQKSLNWQYEQAKKEKKKWENRVELAEQHLRLDLADAALSESRKRVILVESLELRIKSRERALDTAIQRLESVELKIYEVLSGRFAHKNFEVNEELTLLKKQLDNL